MIVGVGEAHFAEVAENGASVQVDFTDSVDVDGIVHDGESSFREGYRRGCGWIESDGVTGIGDPVMLNFEQDIAARYLRRTDQRSGDGTAQIAGSRSEGCRGSVWRQGAKVGDDRAANVNTAVVAIVPAARR